jgi:hypothetical protein
MAALARGIPTRCLPHRADSGPRRKSRTAEEIGRQNELAAVNSLKESFGLGCGGALLGRVEAFAVAFPVFDVLLGDRRMTRSADDNAPRTSERGIAPNAGTVTLGELALRFNVAGQGSTLQGVRHGCLSLRSTAGEKHGRDNETRETNARISNHARLSF